MSHAPWSATKASVALACGRRFFLKYVKREQGLEPASSHGRVGNAAHVLVEMILKGRTPESAYIRAVTDKELTKTERQSVGEYMDSAESFKARVDAFKAKYGMDNVTVLQELPLAFDANMRAVDYWDKNALWRGKLDAVMIVAHKGRTHITVIDHKTGTRNDEKEDSYRSQLESYVVALLAKYPDAEAVVPAIHWMKSDDEAQRMQFFPAISAADIRTQVWPKVVAYYASAEAATQSTAPTLGWYCSYCEYYRDCVASKP